MLISTRLREKLTKVIELEVGRESFLINIVELGLQITSLKIEKEKTHQKLPSSPEDSSSGTSSSISSMSNGKVTCSKEVEVSLDCCMGNTFKVGVTLNDVNERRLVGEDTILGSCQLVQKVSKEMSHSWPEREKETVENLNKVDQSRLEGTTSGSESDQQDDLLVEKVNQTSQPRDIVQKDVEEEGLVGQKENLGTSKSASVPTVHDSIADQDPAAVRSSEVPLAQSDEQGSSDVRDREVDNEQVVESDSQAYASSPNLVCASTSNHSDMEATSAHSEHETSDASLEDNVAGESPLQHQHEQPSQEVAQDVDIEPRKKASSAANTHAMITRQVAVLVLQGNRAICSFVHHGGDVGPNRNTLAKMDKIDVNELLEAQAHVWNHIFSFINSMSLKCAVDLGIPNIIQNHGKPITVTELVAALPTLNPTKACNIYRLMRILVHSSFFARQKLSHAVQEDGYVLTNASCLLLKDNPLSITPFLKVMLDPILTKAWDFLGTCDAQLASIILIDKYKGSFEELDSLVDVGGGTGTVGKAIAHAFPHLNCTVLDLPHVVAGLQDSGNLKYVGGDMFEDVPVADAVLLKSILHDWNDDECLKILKQCKEAISKQHKGVIIKKKVIIIDMVVMDNEKVNEENSKSLETQLFLDMLMMVVLTGRERREEEWAKLFCEAGFSDYKIIPILGLRSLIECVFEVLLVCISLLGRSSGICMFGVLAMTTSSSLPVK
ncbi:hypothetical protein V6N11_044960 [Hibiscus sabdariffa]|uniref:Uncharacterized protein n=1 Tax=Hibiscus sabdariffa TaxID=183260 RepID=A0ABR2PUF8_9ROSI